MVDISKIREKSGFTLLEIVVAIGLLLLVVSFTFVQSRGREQGVDLSAGELASAIRLGHTLEYAEESSNGSRLELSSTVDGLEFVLWTNNEAKPRMHGLLARNVELFIRKQGESTNIPRTESPLRKYTLFFSGKRITSTYDTGMTLILKDKNTQSQRVLTIVPTSGRVLIKP